MSAAVWWAVLATSAGCYAAKLAGLAVPTRVLAHPVVRRIAELVPVALLAALVMTQTVAEAAGSGVAVVLDARAAALLAAIGLLLVRAPFLVVVIGSAAAAAGVRLI